MATMEWSFRVVILCHLFFERLGRSMNAGQIVPALVPGRRDELLSSTEIRLAEPALATPDPADEKLFSSTFSFRFLLDLTMWLGMNAQQHARPGGDPAKVVPGGRSV
ncbi:hypothetical protein [Sinorhizobium meliloti]|uniref:hypothetical protein n=1 Tax=Rhizobium meliloti TaxID=382 RepID=UPI0018657961|nr:hypothetical protein [Sinorhizobium meliloti]MDE3854381.1 hypothetical protein [Sinorhizobium meliloti]